MQPVSSSRVQIRLCLDKLLTSQTFGHADRLREFLRFIVEEAVSDESSSLKETVIGVTVFGRSPGYDPKLDNIVRTSARRVRLKLEEYYATEGAADPVRIELQKGSYLPLFHPRDAGVGSDEPALIIPEAAPSVEIPSASRRHWSYTKAVFYAIAAACFLGIALFMLLRVRRQEGLAWHSTPFTISSGYQNFPDFSPDGKRVAFTWAGPDGGPRQVYVQAVGSFTPKRLTDSASEAIRPAWSPDGQQIAYLQLGTAGRKNIYRIAPDGGKRHKLTSLTGSDPWLCNEARLSWSPTGKELASVAENELDGTCGVVLIDIASGTRRWLTHPSAGQLADLEPAFSPDGKSVAFLRQSSASIGDIFLVPATGGEPRRLSFDNREVRGFSWSGVNGFVVSSRRKGNFLNLWRIPLGTGTPVSLTDGPLNLGFPSVSAAGDGIAYVAYRDDSNIWRFDGHSNRSWIESSGSESSACYSPDGRRIAFVSDRAGNLDLWIADADGRNPVRITNFSMSPVGSPAWSPDSRRLAFDLRVAGQSHIYQVEAGPGHPSRRLTTGSRMRPSLAGPLTEASCISLLGNRACGTSIESRRLEGKRPKLHGMEGSGRSPRSTAASSTSPRTPRRGFGDYP